MELKRAVLSGAIIAEGIAACGSVGGGGTAIGDCTADTPEDAGWLSLRPAKISS